MLNWAKQFNIFCFLDNQQYKVEAYECLLGVNARNFFDDKSSFKDIEKFLTYQKEWTFGHCSYGLKNQLYQLPPKKRPIDFPDFFFFQPEILVLIRKGELTIDANEPDNVLEQLLLEKDFIQEANEVDQF